MIFCEKKKRRENNFSDGKQKVLKIENMKNRISIKSNLQELLQARGQT